MSFWENNKETFKKVGKSTAKGIGQGTKTISNAGYKTYKNHKSGKPNEEEGEEHEVAPVHINSVDISTLPAPPRRNVSTVEPPKVGEASVAHYQNIQARNQELASAAPAAQVVLPPRPVLVAPVSATTPATTPAAVPVAVPPVAAAPAQANPLQNSFVSGLATSAINNYLKTNTTPGQTPVQFTPEQVTTMGLFATKAYNGYQSVTAAQPQAAQTPGQTAPATTQQTLPSPPSRVAGSQGMPPPPPLRAVPVIPESIPAPVVTQNVYVPPVVEEVHSALPKVFAPLSPYQRSEVLPPPQAPDGKVKYVALDTSKFAPPPKPFRSESERQKEEAERIRRQNAVANRDEYANRKTASPGPPPPPVRNSLATPPSQPISPAPVATNGLASASISSLPPPPQIYRGPDNSHPSPPAHSNAFSQTGSPVAIPPALAKKAPPPKPAKLAQKPPAHPPSYEEVLEEPTDVNTVRLQPASSPSQPINFANEIAKLHQSSNPDKPEKPQKSQKPQFTGKPFKPKQLSHPAGIAPTFPKRPVAEVAPSFPQRPSVAGPEVQEDNAPEFPKRPSQRRSTFDEDTETPPLFPKRPSATAASGEDNNGVSRAFPSGASQSKMQAHASIVSSLESIHLSKSEAKTSPPAKPPRPKAKPTIPKKPSAMLVSTPPASSSPTPPVPPAARNTPFTPSSVVAEQTAHTPPPPPPVRNYNRAAVSIPKTIDPNLIDLELHTGWFAELERFVVPKSLNGKNFSSSYQYQGQDAVRVIKVRLDDLSIALITISWKMGNISSAKAEVKTIQPSPLYSTPAPLKSELISAHEKFGEYVAAWCEHNKGKQVASGECWDLAHQALLKGCGKHAFVSEYYHHGFPILELKDGKVVNGPLDEVRRGDILQFTSCTFHDSSRGYTQTVGMPNHTSVVVGHENNKILVLEQNVNNVRVVVDGSYDLRNLTKGEVTVYRPMAASWAGSV